MSLLNNMLKLSRGLLESNIIGLGRALPAYDVRRWKSKKSRRRAPGIDGTFESSDMEINLIPDEKMQKKPDYHHLPFGTVFTDYMFSVKWDTENGWGVPKIAPISSFRVHPASKCLHYGVEVFESMQAYRGYDGHIRLFRPDLNMKRLLAGAQRMCLPTFEGDQLIDCIRRLVKLEQDWIPETEGSSLYVRPVFIGTDPSINMKASASALLYVLLCPIGDDVHSRPISLYADSNFVKSWPGGCGDIKMGGNYGSQIFVHKMAEKTGCQQILWMQGKGHEITDIGNMNIFFVITNSAGEKELVTPPLNGLILNGIVRQSIVELCAEWDTCKLQERPLTMSEFKTLLSEKRIKEVFGSGTSRIVTPVSSIVYEGTQYDIPTTKQDKPIYEKLKKVLASIQYGKIDHKWGVTIDD